MGEKVIVKCYCCAVAVHFPLDTSDLNTNKLREGWDGVVIFNMED